MATWAPTVLRWIAGFWCFTTLFFCGLMLFKPEVALSIFHTNPRLFGHDAATPDENEVMVDDTEQDNTNAHKQNERHLQKMVGLQGIARALYGIFAIVSGDNNQIVSYCIVNIIVDSCAAVQYYSQMRIIRAFQVYIHVIMMAVFNVLQLIFVCLSLSEYKVKNE